MKRYVAIKKGYDGVKVREPDEEFSFAGEPGGWMKEVPIKKDAEPLKPGKKDKKEQ